MKTLILILSLLAFPVFGQDKPAAKPDSLTLSAAEMKAGTEADTALKSAVEALNRALLASDAVQNDADAMALGWKTATLFRRVKDAQATFNEWLEGVRSAHGCAGCSISEGKLVRPPAPDKK